MRAGVESAYTTAWAMSSGSMTYRVAAFSVKKIVWTSIIIQYVESFRKHTLNETPAQTTSAPW